VILGLIVEMGSVVRATLKKTNSSICVFQRSNGFVARFFSTEAQQPPQDSTPRFLHTDNSGIPFLWICLYTLCYL
jgi:hypothetical protein